MIKIHRSTRLAFTFASAVALASAGVGIAVTQGSSAADRRTSTRLDLRVARTTSRTLALTKLDRKFAIFHRGVLSDTANARVAASSGGMAERLQSALAANASMTPSIATSTKAGGFPIAVVAGSERIGIYHEAIGERRPGVMSGSSRSRANAEQMGVWDINETTTGEVNDFGLVPNGNSFVIITYAGGASEQVSVSDNVVEVSGPRTGAAPEAATYDDAEGNPVTVRLPVPGPAPEGPGPGE